jgi:hypothetical protein
VKGICNSVNNKMRKPHHLNKLSDRQVRGIYLDHKTPRSVLAERTGVSTVLVGLIQRRKHREQSVSDLPDYFRRDQRSVRSGNRKLNDQLARQAYQSPLSDKEVARQFGVCERTISRLRKKVTYRNVTMGL